MKILLVLGLSFGALVSFASKVVRAQANVAVEPKQMYLEVFLAADKRTYKRGDRIKLEVRLTNDNAVSDLFVYATLEFGYRGSFTLYRRDIKGREVPTRMIDEALESRPKPEDSAAFVRLLPFHFLGTTYRSTIYLLHLERPGRYSMWVEYHCPISTADVRVSPFWGSESGIIKSNVVWIEVKP